MYVTFFPIPILRHSRCIILQMSSLYALLWESFLGKCVARLIDFLHMNIPMSIWCNDGMLFTWFFFCRKPRAKWRLCSKVSRRRLTGWANGAKRPKWPSSASTRNWLTSPVSHTNHRLSPISIFYHCCCCCCTHRTMIVIVIIIITVTKMSALCRDDDESIRRIDIYYIREGHSLLPPNKGI